MLDEKERVVYQKRLSNDLSLIRSELSPYQSQIQGVAIESTFNWYWLVDGLMDVGFKVHLVNTAAVKQYEGLKYTDDEHDARWLAHLRRLDILPTGHIYPKHKRPLRDLLRKRGQLVRYRTAQILSIQNLMSRNTGHSIKDKEIRKLSVEKIDGMFSDSDLSLAMKSNLVIKECFDQQIKVLEKTILKKAKAEPMFDPLLSVDGIGKILGLTIMLETGNINRFKKVGNYASYCRCVSSKKISNGK